MEEKIFRFKKSWAFWTALGLFCASGLLAVIQMTLGNFISMGEVTGFLLLGLLFVVPAVALSVAGLFKKAGTVSVGAVLASVGFGIIGFASIYIGGESAGGLITFPAIVFVALFAALRKKQLNGGGSKKLVFVFLGLSALMYLLYLFLVPISFGVSDIPETNLFGFVMLLYVAGLTVTMFAEINVETVYLENFDGSDGAVKELPADLKKTRSIPVLLLLTAVTFGIYGLVWFYQNARKVRRLNGESVKGVGSELFLSIVFGLFYNPYFYYTRAKQMSDSADRLGLSGIVKKPVIYLLLTLFGLELVAKVMLTADFNTMADVACGRQDLYSEPATADKIKLTERAGIIKIALLSIITFGIYWQVTLYRMANKVKLINGKQAARGKQVIAMMLVPFYLVYWLISRRGKYRTNGNDATIQAYCLLMLPMYNTYWLITRSKELAFGAEKLGMVIADDSVWMLIFASVMPMLGFMVTQISCNKVADTLAEKGV